MAKVENLDRLMRSFKVMEKQAKDVNGVSVIVGFTQSYAIYVHENLEAYHPVGQAKFLEQPARDEAILTSMRSIIFQTLQAGKTMLQALLLAGLRLQREAQLLTPVDTGALRASAFTRPE